MREIALSPTCIANDYLEALTRLNEICTLLHNDGATGQAGVAEILRVVVDSAAQVVADASAVICPYDATQAALDASGRVIAAASGMAPGADPWCPQDLGARALAQGQPLLSYPAEGPGVEPAVAAFPMLAGGQPAGVLYVFLPVGRRFSALELLMLENFVNQAAMAIDRARQLAGIQRDLARKEDELARLRHAGLLISSRLRLEETLEAILQMAMEVTGAHYGVFRLVDRGGQALVTRAIAGEHLGRPATEPLPINATSIMGWVAKQRRPLRISDLRAEPWSRVYYPLDHELQMRSELAVPLIGIAGRLEGVLNLESPTLDAFSEADSHLLQALAAQAVIAIQQARLLDALQEIAGRILAQPAAQVLDRVAQLAAELLSAAAGLTWSRRDGRQILVAADAGSEWDQKVLAILNHYAALAQQNAARQEALRTAQEQRAVAETFAAMGDIAANLLHHLNNKVGAIPVRVEGIQAKCAPVLAANPYLAANLAEIERSADEAMQAVRDSLSLLHPIYLERLAVAGCVEAALATVHLPPGVSVQTAGLAGLPPVLAGRHSLTLVMVNLLTNAAEAMRGQGVITIRGETGSHGEVVIDVSDNGPGIPPELHERIFELHFSSRPGPATHKLGFGLWWVKTLIARLGGSITVESDGKRGTTFRLRLPEAP